MKSIEFRFALLVFVMLVLCSISNVCAKLNENDKGCLVSANEYITESDFALVSTSSDLGNSYRYIGDSSYIYELDLSNCESVPSDLDVFNEVISLNVSNMGLSDLSFIEALPNLMVVNASSNALTYFPLVNDSIEELYLENNAIIDITNLFSILDSNPSFLFDLNGNKIDDIQYKQLVNNYGIDLNFAPSLDSIEINGNTYKDNTISYESNLEAVEITLTSSYVFDTIQVYKKEELVSDGSSSFTLENNGTYEVMIGDISICTIDLVIKVDDSNEISEPIVSEDNEEDTIIPDIDTNEENEIIDETPNEVEPIEEELIEKDDIKEPIIEELPYTASFDYMWYGVGLLFIIYAITFTS